MELTESQNRAMEAISHWYKEEESNPIFTLSGYAGCLDKHTLILVRNTKTKEILYVPLGEICAELEPKLKFTGFIPYTTKTYEIVDRTGKFKKISQIFATDEMTLGYKIILSNGIILKGSYKQPIVVRTPGGLESWVQFKDLHENDRVLLYHHKPTPKFKQYFQKDSNDTLEFQKLGIQYCLFRNLFTEYEMIQKEYKQYVKAAKKVVNGNILSISEFKPERYYKHFNKHTVEISGSDKEKRLESLKRVFRILGHDKDTAFPFTYSKTKDKEILTFNVSLQKFFPVSLHFEKLEHTLNNTAKIAAFLRGFLLASYLINPNHKSLYFPKDHNTQYLLSILELLGFYFIYNSKTQILYFTESYIDYIIRSRYNTYKMSKGKNDAHVFIKDISTIHGKFFDLTVEGSHFIANTVISHNTGKTTCVKSISDFLGINEDSIAVCCFTGKATTVLRSKGFRNARTIHSTFYQVEEESKEMKFQNNTIVLGSQPKMTLRSQYEISSLYELIIIDEFSMVDSEMLKDLLSFGIPILALGDSF
jgi:hypothetical protein